MSDNEMRIAFTGDYILLLLFDKHLLLIRHLYFNVDAIIVKFRPIYISL